MGRPKGSKNKVKRAAPKSEETVEERITAVKEHMDTLSAAVSELSAEMREKKKQMVSAKKELSALLSLKEQLQRAEADAKRQEQARQIADAFLASGKTVEDVLPLLEVKV